jgi:quercetin dioxygenase-like cupin family protein
MGGHETVGHADRCPPATIGNDTGATARALIPARADSPLALDVVELAPGASVSLGDDPDRHELVYVLSGQLELERGAGRQVIAADSAFLHDGTDGTLAVRAGAGPARLARFGAGPACDEHAALGERRDAVELDLTDAGSATGKRSFQVLLGPENGCCRATMFVGVVPPGAAPWHFHQYDEIVYLIDGGGTYHQAAGAQATTAGSAVRITPRTVHINENGTDAEMHVLGVFTPAGSPAAAYLADAPAGAPTSRRPTLSRRGRRA